MDELQQEKSGNSKNLSSLKDHLKNAMKNDETQNNVRENYYSTIEKIRRKNEQLSKCLKKKTVLVVALEKENTILQFNFDTKFHHLMRR